ncbi:MAG: hypothetical protein ACR2OH_10220 [Microthrixaceae bacterium]
MTAATVPRDPEFDQADLRHVVGELRSARRRRRLGDTDWFELAYRVYTTAFVGLVVTIMLSGWVGSSAVPVESVQTFATQGPAWVGLGLALALLVAIRSGSRGGPLSVEAADVHHVLASPVRRSSVLRRPSSEVLGYGVLGGVVVSAVCGSFISQRVPGGTAEWVGSGALFGAMVMLVALGAALLTASRVSPRWVPLALGWILLLWAVADVADTGPAAPTTYAARLLFLPVAHLGPDPAWVGAPWGVLAILLPVAGVVFIGGLSIEAARRRTELVTQLRFAVTVQDLRSVILLRRQLASEVPRTRPWFRVPRIVDRRWPVFARDMRSVAHWPVIRVGRVLVFAVAAALAVRAMYAGSVPLVVVAGLASFVVALDATEPLSQDIDHPLLAESVPIDQGRVMVRHLVQPTIVLVVVAAIALTVVWALSPSPEVWGVGLVLLATAPAAAVAGAAVSVVSTVDSGAADQLMTPEIAGPRMVFRTVWPPLIATVGFLPALIASLVDSDGGPQGVAVSVAMPVLLLVAVVFGWVRFRSSIHDSMASAMGTKEES